MVDNTPDSYIENLPADSVVRLISVNRVLLDRVGGELKALGGLKLQCNTTTALLTYDCLDTVV